MQTKTTHDGLDVERLVHEAVSEFAVVPEVVMQAVVALLSRHAAAFGELIDRNGLDEHLTSSGSNKRGIGLDFGTAFLPRPLPFLRFCKRFDSSDYQRIRNKANLVVSVLVEFVHV